MQNKWAHRPHPSPPLPRDRIRLPLLFPIQLLRPPASPPTFSFSGSSGAPPYSLSARFDIQNLLPSHTEPSGPTLLPVTHLLQLGASPSIFLSLWDRMHSRGTEHCQSFYRSLLPRFLLVFLGSGPGSKFGKTTKCVSKGACDGHDSHCGGMILIICGRGSSESERAN